jgi:ferritin-like metal-binding protein YciE
MAKLQSLRAHLIAELRDLLDAEQQLTQVLPDFADRASMPALRTAFEQHLRETEGQIHRLKQAFEALGELAQTKRCEGMHGLIREGNAVVNSTPEGALRDAVMITSAQKVEHYEMAAYGTARTYATVLGEPEVATLLEDALAEEKSADAKLTEIAEGRVNEKAAEEWHQVAAGFLEQSATIAGKAVGIGARTVKRAADAVGLGPSGTSKVRGQVTSSVGGAVEAASDLAGDVPSSVRSQARRLTVQTALPHGSAQRSARLRGPVIEARRKSNQRSKGTGFHRTARQVRVRNLDGKNPSFCWAPQEQDGKLHFKGMTNSQGDANKIWECDQNDPGLAEGNRRKYYLQSCGGPEGSHDARAMSALT